MYAVLLVNGQFVWPPEAGARAYWNYVCRFLLLITSYMLLASYKDAVALAAVLCC